MFSEEIAQLSEARSAGKRQKEQYQVEPSLNLTSWGKANPSQDPPNHTPTPTPSMGSLQALSGPSPGDPVMINAQFWPLGAHGFGERVSTVKHKSRGTCRILWLSPRGSREPPPHPRWDGSRAKLEEIKTSLQLAYEVALPNQMHELGHHWPLPRLGFHLVK